MFTVLDIWWMYGLINVEFLNFSYNKDSTRSYSVLAFDSLGSYLEVFGYRIIDNEWRSK